MAVDTQNKRRATVGVLPVPDGTIATADRQHVLWIYPGILAGAPSGGVLPPAPTDPPVRPCRVFDTTVTLPFLPVRCSGVNPDEIRLAIERLNAYLSQFLSDADPKAAGTTAPGTSNRVARADHVHEAQVIPTIPDFTWGEYTGA